MFIWPYLIVKSAELVLTAIAIAVALLLLIFNRSALIDTIAKRVTTVEGEETLSVPMEWLPLRRRRSPGGISSHLPLLPLPLPPVSLLCTHPLRFLLSPQLLQVPSLFSSLS